VVSGSYFEACIFVANFTLSRSSLVILLIGIVPSGQPLPFSQKLDELNNGEELWFMLPLGLEVGLFCTKSQN
jgi:hypothetical protein